MLTIIYEHSLIVNTYLKIFIYRLVFGMVVPKQNHNLTSPVHQSQQRPFCAV